MKVPEYIKNNREIISALNPGEQAIPYVFSSWNKYFSEDQVFQSLAAKFPYEISRSNVFEIRKNIGSNPTEIDLKHLFMAVMIWGFGTTGYGAFRTNEMLNDGRFIKTVKYCFNKVQEGDFRSAYDSFFLNWCGSAFFTKFFYFSASNCLEHNIIPLVLDAVVARSLEEKCDCDVRRYAIFNRYTKDTHAKTFNPLLSGKISSVDRSSELYINYIQDMSKWANEISARPDQIELFLFS